MPGQERGVVESADIADDRPADQPEARDQGSVTVPTLVIGARHDTMDPAHMEMMAGRFPRGRYLYCASGSHMAMYDDQATWFGGLIDFLVDPRIES